MKMLHYYADPIGTGEFSKNRFRPVCDPFAQPVFIPASEQHDVEPAEGDTVCETCAAAKAAMLDLGMTR